MRRLSNILDSYMSYAAYIESPLNYLEWSALHATAATLKRQVYVQWGQYRIYPAMYLIFVGKPGIGKGSAINPVVKLVNKNNYVNYLYDKMSAEKIVEQLALGFQKLTTTQTQSGPGVQLGFTVDTAASIVSTEFQTFLSTSEWMLPLLCDLWDKDEFHYNMKTKPTRIIKDVSLNLIGGCVPDYIRRLNKDSTVSVTSGFTSRCIFCFANEQPEKIYSPPDMSGTQLEKDLLHDLDELGKLNGELKFSVDAHEAFKHYDRVITIGQFDSEVVANFKSRLRSHIIKVAINLSCAEGDTLLIDEIHIEQSVQLVQKILSSLDITFRNVGESPMLIATERVMDYIESISAGSYQEIYRACHRHVTEDDFRKVLGTLETALQYITQRQFGNKTMYVSTGIRLKEREEKLYYHRNGASNTP